jgi:PIN domain nuclease of toxin-antitoxin system
LAPEEDLEEVQEVLTEVHHLLALYQQQAEEQEVEKVLDQALQEVLVEEVQTLLHMDLEDQEFQVKVIRELQVLEAEVKTHLDQVQTEDRVYHLLSRVHP